MFRNWSLLVVATICLGRAAEASFIPAGLSPGDQYHLAFITHNARLPGEGASSSDIGVYNAFVHEEAALNSSLTGTDQGVDWFAIASTPTVNARDNALISAPVYLLDGTKIANGFADMWDGTLASGIGIDQFQHSVASGHSYPLAWTGSHEDGTAFVGWSMGDTFALYGEAAFSSPKWITSAHSTATNGNIRMYAISEVLTAPVPEPSTFALLGMGVTGLCGCRSRRKRHRFA